MKALTNCSRHASIDRTERIAEILMGVGLGEEMYRRRWYNENEEPVDKVLTTTGVMIIYRQDSDFVITMYIATARQVRALYGMNHCPSYIYNVVKKNEKRYKHLIDGRV